MPKRKSRAARRVRFDQLPPGRQYAYGGRLRTKAAPAADDPPPATPVLPAPERTQEARLALYKSCDLLAFSLRRKLTRRVPELADEVEGEIRLALWRATVWWDEAVGVKFSSYAYTVMMRAGMVALRQEHARGLVGFQGDEARLNWTTRRVLDSETPDGYSLVAHQPTRRSEAAEAADAAEAREVTDRILAGVNPREAHVLRRRLTDPDVSFREMTAEMRVSIERIRQLEVRGLDQARLRIAELGYEPGRRACPL